MIPRVERLIKNLLQSGRVSCKSHHRGRGIRKATVADGYKFYNLIIVAKWSGTGRSCDLFGNRSFIKSKIETLRCPVLFTKTNGSFDRDPVSFVAFFFFPKQAILSRRCPLFLSFRVPFLRSSVAVRSSLVIFNYRIFNRELLRLSRHGCLLFRESFAPDRRVARRQFIYINSE
jgi:hypothetical protein